MIVQECFIDADIDCPIYPRSTDSECFARRHIQTNIDLNIVFAAVGPACISVGSCVGLLYGVVCSACIVVKTFSTHVSSFMKVAIQYNNN